MENKSDQMLNIKLQTITKFNNSKITLKLSKAKQSNTQHIYAERKQPVSNTGGKKVSRCHSAPT